MAGSERSSEASATTATAAIEYSPFRLLEEDSITCKNVLSQFRAFGFVWIRQKPATASVGPSNSILSCLRNSYNEKKSAYEEKWTVENRGNYQNDADLSAAAVLGGESVKEKFYVSTIIRETKTLDSLFESLPYSGQGVPPLLGESLHDNGGWLFIGSNPVSSNACSTGTCSPTTSTIKRKRSAAMKGRAEHVDEVEHSGTWHLQLSGSKTWIIRPDKEAVDWSESGPPDIKGSEYAEQSDKRAWRLRIRVVEGDLFILNTRAWFHRTEIEASTDLSVSIARDFYLPVDPMYALTDYSEGDIICDENELPDDIQRSNNPNCRLEEADVNNVDSHGDVGDSEEDASIIILTAITAISKGDPLTIALDASIGDGNEKCNAPDAVDPRALCKRSAKKGDILLRNDEIPEDLFCSQDPSCEVVEVGEDVVLRALRDIDEGGVLSLIPMEGVEYEELEVDTATGELQ